MPAYVPVIPEAGAVKPPGKRQKDAEMLGKSRDTHGAISHAERRVIAINRLQRPSFWPDPFPMRLHIIVDRFGYKSSLPSLM